MSEVNNQPSYQRGRKKYESNKTLAQQWMGRGIVAGIVLILGLILFKFGFTVYLLFAKPDRDGPLIWATTEGIGYSAKGGEVTGYFKLPTSAGESVKNPRFNVIGGKLVYYAPELNSLCIVAEGEQQRWVNLDNAIGTDCTVRDIRPMGNDTIVAIAYAKNSDPDSLPLPVAAARLALTANDATPLAAQDVVCGPQGKTVVRTKDGFSGIKDAPKSIVSWDYDFSGNRFCASDGKGVSSISGDAKVEFGLGPLYYIRNVAVLKGDVWMAAVKPFKAGYLLLSYGPDGSFKKLKLKDKTDIRPPYIEPTPELIDLLTKLSGGVQE